MYVGLPDLAFPARSSRLLVAADALSLLVVEILASLRPAWRNPAHGSLSIVPLLSTCTLQLAKQT